MTVNGEVRDDGMLTYPRIRCLRRRLDDLYGPLQSVEIRDAVEVKFMDWCDLKFCFTRSNLSSARMTCGVQDVAGTWVFGLTESKHLIQCME